MRTDEFLSLLSGVKSLRCPNCDLEFVTTNTRKVYCTRRCKNLAAQRRYNKTSNGRAKQREYARSNAEKIKETKQRWAENNPEKVRQSQKQAAEKRRALVVTKKSEGCLDCGETDARVIQLHAPRGHSLLAPRHGKGNERRRVIGNGSGWGMAALVSELAECIPLCANCHIRRHIED